MAALALAVASVYYAMEHLSIRTSRKYLISGDKSLIQRTDNVDRVFGGRDGLIVVVENVERRRSIRFIEALAAELRRHSDRFPELFYRLNPKRFQPWALLYPGVDDLLKLERNIQGQQKLLKKLAADPQLVTFYGQINEQITQTMIGSAFTGFLEETSKQDLPDVTLLNASLEQLQLSLAADRPYVSPFSAFFPGGISDPSEQGYFFMDNDKFLLFLVTQRPGVYTESAQNLNLLRDAIARVRQQFPGIKAGVTGPDALEADEMSSAMRDIALATWLSLMGQMALLIIFLRAWRRPLVEVACLSIGLCWTFGFVTLAVGHLNLLSIIFTPLMLGLAINYGIHWFARLQEEEVPNQGQCTPEAITCAFYQTLPGISCAGLAAMVSFLPLAFVHFKGLAELGLILSVGIVIMLIATLLLAPSLVMASERCLPNGTPHRCPAMPPPFLQLKKAFKYSGWIVGLGGIIVLLGIVSLTQVRFDLNPLHLQNPRVGSVVWEERLLKESKYSTAFGILTAGSLKELHAKIESLKKLYTVSHVESVLSFLPAYPDLKRSILEGLSPLLSAVDFPLTVEGTSNYKELAEILRRINFKMDEAAKDLEKDKTATAEQIQETHLLINKLIPILDPGRNPQVTERLANFEHHFFTDLHDKWELLQGYLHSALTTPPMTLRNLPVEVIERFYRGEYLIRVFPSQDIWNFANLSRFVSSLWRVDAGAVGDPALLYVFIQKFRNSILWAAGFAVMAIVLLLALFYRSITMAMLALIPLWVGTGLTVIMMWLLDLPFNQANVLFLPLILGEGVEFGIIILTRWQMEEKARYITLPASTAKGVALAALTTTVGFGSLMVSNHHGVFTLGLLATVGSLSVLLASLSVLPALLHLMKKRLTPAPNLFYSLLGAPARNICLLQIEEKFKIKPNASQPDKSKPAHPGPS